MNESLSLSHECRATPAPRMRRKHRGRAQRPSAAHHPAPAIGGRALGQPVTFSITAEGEAIRYQWFHNGDAIPGATSSSYTIASVQASDSGQYFVVLTNGAGSVRSNSAKLTVATGAGDAEVTVQ